MLNHPKEIICRFVLNTLVKLFGFAHILNAVEWHISDTAMNPAKPMGDRKMDVLNQFGLSVLIEHLADIEGVATEIGWLQEIRQEEALEAARSR